MHFNANIILILFLFIYFFIYPVVQLQHVQEEHIYRNVHWGEKKKQESGHFASHSLFENHV